MALSICCHAEKYRWAAFHLSNGVCSGWFFLFPLLCTTTDAYRDVVSQYNDRYQSGSADSYFGGIERDGALRD